MFLCTPAFCCCVSVIIRDPKTEAKRHLRVLLNEGRTNLAKKLEDEIAMAQLCLKLDSRKRQVMERDELYGDLYKLETAALVEPIKFPRSCR